MVNTQIYRIREKMTLLVCTLTDGMLSRSTSLKSFFLYFVTIGYTRYAVGVVSDYRLCIVRMVRVCIVWITATAGFAYILLLPVCEVFLMRSSCLAKMIRCNLRYL